jgi:hypothetical protein
MEHEYRYRDEILDTSIKAINATLDRYKLMFQKDILTKKGGNQISDLRTQTALLLKKPFGQICSLTKGWSIEQIYTTLHLAEQFINPPALWWVIYKEKKNIYGKSNNRISEKDRKKKRSSNLEEQRPGTLF